MYGRRGGERRALAPSGADARDLEYLAIRPDGVYLDMTAGLGVTPARLRNVWWAAL